MAGLIWIQSVRHPDGIEKKSRIQRVKYGTIMNCEGIIKAILENPKTDQNTFFPNYVIFEPPANDLYLYCIYIFTSEWLMAG